MSFETKKNVLKIRVQNLSIRGVAEIAVDLCMRI